MVRVVLKSDGENEKRANRAVDSSSVLVGKSRVQKSSESERERETEGGRRGRQSERERERAWIKRVREKSNEVLEWAHLPP